MRRGWAVKLAAPALSLLPLQHAVRAEPVRLAYKWQKGKVLRYAISVSVNASSSLPLPTGGELNTETRGRNSLKMSLEAVKVHKDGSADVLVRVQEVTWRMKTFVGEWEFDLSIRVTPKGPECTAIADGEEQEVPDEMRKRLDRWADFVKGLSENGFLIRVSPTGKVLKVGGLDWAGEETAKRFWEALKRTGDFPEKPVDEGDTWKRWGLFQALFALLQSPEAALGKEVKVPEGMGGEEPSALLEKAAEQCELGDFAEVEGRKCTKILLHSEVEVREEGVSLTFSSDGTLYFAPEEGLLVREESNIEGTIEADEGPSINLSGRYNCSLLTGEEE